MRALAIALICCIAAGCLSSGRTHHRGGPVYFGRMDLYRYKPVQQLSAAEIENRRSAGTGFWSAHFDDSGRILIAENHSATGIVAKIEYTYEDGRRSSIRETLRDGTVREKSPGK